MIATYYPEKRPPIVLARARTAGGIYRQLYAQWRREFNKGIFAEGPRLVISKR